MHPSDQNSSESVQKPLDLVTVFPFINIPTTQQYYDISHIIPNIKLRIRWDGNIPQPTLSFSNMLNNENFKNNYGCDYSKIPNGIEVWQYVSWNNFKNEYYNTIIKDILTPHNEYMYALKPYHNYQIAYNNIVILQLTNQQGWNIHQPTPPPLVEPIVEPQVEPIVEPIVEPSAPILPYFFW